MRNLLIVILFFSFLDLSIAQEYAKGVVTLKDGQEIECEIRFPIRNGRYHEDLKIIDKNKPHKQLTIKLSNGKEESIFFDEISEIEATSKNSTIYLIYTEVYIIKKKKPPVPTKYKLWLKPVAGCEELMYFLECHELDLDKNGEFVEKYLDGMGMQMLQRKNENIPTFIGYFYTLKDNNKAMGKHRKSLLSSYLKDNNTAMNYLSSKKMIFEEDFERLIIKLCD